jgi:nucleoside-diphosphate-sugar epimerase
MSGDRETVLLFGGTGYIGTLIAASLLARTHATVTAPIRAHREPQAARECIAEEARAIAPVPDEDIESRLHMVAYDDVAELKLRLSRPDTVINAAGSVDYFDAEELQDANIRLTEDILDVARALRTDRFVFISTAFSCGYSDGVATETLHDEPEADPTVYTRSKRHAEHLVANSGIPYLVLRPSVVIGDSQSGRYTGRRYGLYQFLSGTERLLCRAYHRELHLVAPDKPVHFLHQDAFQAAFLAALRHVHDDAFVNVVAPEQESPTLRELWQDWMSLCSMPERVVYYDRLADVPLQEIDPRQRAFLSFASVNTDIAAHTWRFARTTLDTLATEQGLQPPSTTLHSVRRCQEAFIGASEKCARFRARFAEQMPDTPREVVEVPAGGGMGGSDARPATLD